MPKRTDIKSILVIGAGPIVIGQACEFDYSGTQACKVLQQEGYKVILVNSNPATIMTDPEFSDSTYIEPITPEMVTKIIKIERPDALLPTMGGQTALNVALALSEEGILKKYKVELIGASMKAISKAENRDLFKKSMKSIGLETPKSFQVSNLTQAKKALVKIGLPAIIRPSYTLGGAGGGIAYNREEYEKIVSRGLEESPRNIVLVEESVLGWKEFEMEVIRDKSDNAIIVCSIENFDPMGIHTGDSIAIAPALTLTDKEFQNMRNASIAVLREIGVETGGSNVQFAVNPKDGRQIVIEMNPRVSRSSALASKATGFPIAKVAARLAVGYTLDEILNDITKTTPASFEPSIDYIVTKIPRFSFEKFPECDTTLTTSMKSVGEVMAIGRTFNESLQKALSSLENNLQGFNEINILQSNDKTYIKSVLGKPHPDRILYIAQALRLGIKEALVCEITNIDPWFIEQIAHIIREEKVIEKNGLRKDRDSLQKLKMLGFSDSRLAKLSKKSESYIRNLRHKLKLHPVFKRIDTCAGEFPSQTPYLYSCYEPDKYSSLEGTLDLSVSEANVTSNKKVIILGSGPNRIGQGIEFDYCCVSAAFAFTECGIETILINCNPETVSTDYDTSDRLYFEPLSLENVIEIVIEEKKKGNLLGLLVQFGGQTPLKLAKDLEKLKIPIIGTSPDSIDIAEDRNRFQKLLNKLKLLQPPNGISFSTKQSINIAKDIGYPLLVRPSYVLGGRAMEIVYDQEHLVKYVNKALSLPGNDPILLDRFLSDAIEVDVDALSDGKDVKIAGIMEHIEEAGIHSGDSACSIPPHSLKKSTIKELERQTHLLAHALNVIGLMNVQFAIKKDKGKDKIFIIEVNPRASRTIPFVAKTTGNPIAKIAAKIMIGEPLKKNKIKPWNTSDRFSLKEAVFPFSRLPGVDLLLGPEMKSTGETMGIDKDFGCAFAKSQIAAGIFLPTTGNVFISVRDNDKKSISKIGKTISDLGFKILATEGTCNFLKEEGLRVERINKVIEGRPHIVDAIKDGQINLILNTTEGKQSIADSFSLRQAALYHRIPYYTTVAGSYAAVAAILALSKGPLEVCSLQTYNKQ